MPKRFKDFRPTRENGDKEWDTDYKKLERINEKRKNKRRQSRRKQRLKDKYDF